MGTDERLREAKGELSSIIESAIGPMAPNLVHAVAAPAVVKPRGKTITLRVRLTKEDHVFLRTIARSRHTQLGNIVARVMTLLCRTIRTGRDPLTGEPIDWRAAYGLDYDVAGRCTDAIMELRQGHHGGNDFLQALANAAQALDELRLVTEAARLGYRDRRKPKRKVEDSFERATSGIEQSATRRKIPADSD